MYDVNGDLDFGDVLAKVETLAAGNEHRVRATRSSPAAMLFSAMQAALVMNTNADHGNWEYAGAYKTNSSQYRVSGEVRRSVTGSTSRSGHGWNMYSGRSSGSLDSPRPATVD